MRIDVIMLSENEAEIHHSPCWLARVLLGRRAMFTPIVRVEFRNPHLGAHATTEHVWRHKHTGRPVEDHHLSMLEKMPVIGEVRRALLLAAAQEA